MAREASANIRAHYEIEKELAARLRAAPAADRTRLYSELYDELFKRIPEHPQIIARATPDARRTSVEYQVALLRRFIGRHSSFLEVGAGDCALTVRVANEVREVIAVDVSEAPSAGIRVPLNFRLLISNGRNIPLPDETVDVAYSNQLMEHLHPDDALDQLRDVVRILKKGGVYVCVTPNRLSGPHDVSADFDHVASGFHLREYTNEELHRYFREAGLSQIRAYIGARYSYFRFPLWGLVLLERVLRAAPFRIRRRMAKFPPIAKLLTVRLAATKL
ncbi:MAG: class I SAM-dependent methyltransferase [Gammaproteobacteria bacterium]|nr:class I SAM-dependent methyltransferase [Gammaproteobacteria bacterium]